MYSCVSSSFQTHFPLHKLIISNSFSNLVTIDFSHWNHSFLQGIDHCHHSSFEILKSHNVPFFKIVFEYNLGYFSFNAISPSANLSKTLFYYLHLCLHLKLLPSQLSFCPLQHILLISLRHKDSWFDSFISSKALQDPYFKSRISFHNPLSSFPSLHFNFFQ